MNKDNFGQLTYFVMSIPIDNGFIGGATVADKPLTQEFDKILRKLILVCSLFKNLESYNDSDEIKNNEILVDMGINVCNERKYNPSNCLKSVLIETEEYIKLHFQCLSSLAFPGFLAKTLLEIGENEATAEYIGLKMLYHIADVYRATKGIAKITQLAERNALTVEKIE